MTEQVVKPTESARAPAASGINDPGAWAVFAEGIRFLALGALGDVDEAADATQETIIRALKAIAGQRGAPVKDPVAFIYGIAKHVIADALRLKSKTVSLELTHSLSASETDVLDALVSKEDRGRLRAALGSLPRAERALLVMTYVRGMTSADIARRLGESADVIRKRKSRAVEKLREEFKKRD